MNSKNIIICSDGTGNKGGYGADTNVYQLHNAIEIHDPGKPQITFYSDGVGTNENKFIRALTAAFGFGFERNIIELYEFLVRTYEPGDQIYLVGFSRGAATARAFAGLIEACGLLDLDKCAMNGDQSRETAIKDELRRARMAYRAHKRNRGSDILSAADIFKAEKAVKHDEYAPSGDLKIKFIGVWDTVSALGIPQDWSWAINWIFGLLEYFSELFFPHNYYNYQLNRNVEYVYHAMAIDDERKTFHPKVWTETRPDRPQNIEQVWFAGAHSNVGGGYPRSGMSTVALDWMMTRAAHLGIQFKRGIKNEVKANANVHGKLYDSRDGIAVYYRYSPRDIETLCKRREGQSGDVKSRLDGPIKIHKSVFDRITQGTARYAPGHLPNKYMIVDTPINNRSTEGEWHPDRAAIGKWVASRKVLYRVFVEMTLTLLAAASWMWIASPKWFEDYIGAKTGFLELIYTFNLFSFSYWDSVYEWAAHQLVDVLRYLLPEFLEPFVIYVLIVRPFLVPLILIVLVAVFLMREFLRNGTQRAYERAHR